MQGEVIWHTENGGFAKSEVFRASQSKSMNLIAAILRLGRHGKAQTLQGLSPPSRRVPARSSCEPGAAHNKSDEQSGESDHRPARGSLAEALLADIRSQFLGSRDKADQAFLTALKLGVSEEGFGPLPMPESVLRIQQLIDHPECQVEELAQAIELDPAMAAKVVGIANSPFYSGMQPVRSVRDALMRIGLHETRNITMAISLHSKVFRVRGKDREAARLWQHALAASIATRAIAEEVGLKPDLGYLGGLLHDVGRVAILTVVADVQRVSRGQLCPQAGTLERAMEKLHARVSALVVGSRNFVPELVEAIAYHHEPEAAPEPATLLAAALSAGDLLARRIVELDVPPSTEELGSALERVQIDEATAAEIEHNSHNAFQVAFNVF